MERGVIDGRIEPNTSVRGSRQVEGVKANSGKANAGKVNAGKAEADSAPQLL